MSDVQISPSEPPSMLTGLGWEFPFERELSLAALIRFWEETIAREDSLRGRMGRALQEELRQAGELAEPINDPGVLTRHREILQVLMGAVFPAVFWEQEHAAALVPFELRSFYATPSFERDFLSGGHLRARLSVDKSGLARFRLLNAYALALSRV